MTYREEIARLLRLNHQANADEESYIYNSCPFPLMHFFMSLAGLINYTAGKVLMQKPPTVSFGDERPKKRKSYKSELSIPVGDITNVILGLTDLVPSINLFHIISGFIDWLLDQPISGDPSEDIWYDINALVDKYNQYITIKGASK